MASLATGSTKPQTWKRSRTTRSTPRLGSAGVDAFTLCSIFGWSDVRVALRYTHPVSKARREAVES